MKPTKTLPYLIVLDSNISLGFEIWLPISVVGTKPLLLEFQSLKLAKNSNRVCPDSLGHLLMKGSVAWQYYKPPPPTPMDEETRVSGDSSWQGHRKVIYLSTVIVQELKSRPPNPLWYQHWLPLKLQKGLSDLGPSLPGMLWHLDFILMAWRTVKSFPRAAFLSASAKTSMDSPGSEVIKVH